MGLKALSIVVLHACMPLKCTTSYPGLLSTRIKRYMTVAMWHGGREVFTSLDGKNVGQGIEDKETPKCKIVKRFLTYIYPRN